MARTRGRGSRGLKSEINIVPLLDVLLVLLLIAGSILGLKQLQAGQQAANQQQELALNALRQEGERLVAEQARHKPDAELHRQNTQLQHQVQIKQLLLHSLSARAMLKSSGFAVVLKAGIVTLCPF